MGDAQASLLLGSPFFCADGYAKRGKGWQSDGPFRVPLHPEAHRRQPF